MSLHVALADTPGQERDRVVDVLRASPGVAVSVVEDLARLERTVRHGEVDIVVVAVDTLAHTQDSIERIMRERPTPIVALSTPGHGELAAALSAGALGVVRRPRGIANEEQEFMDAVRSLATVHLVTRTNRPRPRPRRTGPIEVVAMVASTGGPPALTSVLSSLPAVPSAPILLVQHIAAGFSRNLCDWIDSSTPQRVRLAATGDRPAAGDVLLAPEGQHLTLQSGRIRLLADPPVHGHRPSASVLLHSLAPVGSGALAVVLTGMGSDGADGAAAIYAAGGHVICQDAASSVVHGMPGAVIAAGAASETLPVAQIGPRVAMLLRRSPPGLMSDLADGHDNGTGCAGSSGSEEG